MGSLIFEALSQSDDLVQEVSFRLLGRLCPPVAAAAVMSLLLNDRAVDAFEHLETLGVRPSYIEYTQLWVLNVAGPAAELKHVLCQQLGVALHMFSLRVHKLTSLTVDAVERSLVVRITLLHLVPSSQVGSLLELTLSVSEGTGLNEPTTPCAHPILTQFCLVFGQILLIFS